MSVAPALPAPGAPVSRAIQASFDELGTPLHEVTFVVMDLETTGGSPAEAGITEIGAVKVRGGQCLGEFQTLVRPDVPIPPFIAVLTGITDRMVADAPALPAVLPAFLEFARGAVLVAHNAPFDLAFLRAACAATGRDWPAFTVVDTARLARAVLSRDEVPDCRLATLARRFAATTEPVHRALADARATVDVLHGLLERVGNAGVHSLEGLTTYPVKVSPVQRRKRHLAEGLPETPGVYLFVDGQGLPLYVGKARNLRRRVRSYFTASEPRSRIRDMLNVAEAVRHIPVATDLEAEVRELRLIAERQPRYNRRSRFPERAAWLKLTVEPFPRLSLVRGVRDDGTTYLGPFGSRRQADLALAALHETFRLRQCSPRLSPRRPRPACVLAELGRCSAPCTGTVVPQEYAAEVAAVREAMTGDPRLVVDRMRVKIDRLSGAARFEEAAVHRDRLAAFVGAVARLQRLAGLTNCAELVAARPGGDGGWELAVVRWGRLAAAGVVPPGAAARPYAEALVAAAETVVRGPGPLPAATADETECVLRWLEQPGVRLVAVAGSWCSPAYGAGRWRQWVAAAAPGQEPLGDPGSGVRPVRAVRGH